METLATRTIYDSPWLSLREDAVRRADGSEGLHVVLDGPEMVLVVPVEGDRVRLVVQHRHPLGRESWELASGTAEPEDADAEAVARRELREETGLRAGRLVELGLLDMAPGTSRQSCRVFLATDLEEGDPAPEVAEEGMRSEWFTRAEVAGMVRDGRLADAKSLAAYALLLLAGAGALQS